MLDQLPDSLPLPIPSAPPQVLPPSPLPRNLKKFLPPLFSLLIVLLLAAIIANFIKSPRPGTTSEPVVATTSEPEALATPSAITPFSTPVVPRLALTSLSGRQLITVSNQKIYLIDFTAQGPRKSPLASIDHPIVDVSLSPDRNTLAFTFGSGNTGLSVLSLKDKSLTEFISPTEQVRYPLWSPDSIYLAVWNSGSSTILYDMTTRRRHLEFVASGSGELNLGHIVFLPTQPKISYVENGSLYESEYTGSKKIKVADGVNPVLTFSQPPVPDLHYYSTDGRYVVFHNTLGQLVMLDRRDGSTQTLAEGTARFSFGGVVAFENNGQILVYYDVGKEIYSPDTDENPFYSYRFDTDSRQPFFSNRKLPLPLTGLLPDTPREKLLAHYQGFSSYSFDGKMLSNCPYTPISYDYTFPPPQLLSPDGKYVVSPKTVQIADANDCSITAAFDTETPSHVIWVK